MNLNRKPSQKWWVDMNVQLHGVHESVRSQHLCPKFMPVWMRMLLGDMLDLPVDSHAEGVLAHAAF